MFAARIRPHFLLIGRLALLPFLWSICVPTDGTAQVRQVEVILAQAEEPRVIELQRASSQDDALQEVLGIVRREGFLHASVDSASMTSRDGAVLRVFLDVGPEVTIGRIEVEGDPPLSLDEVRRFLRVSAGDRLDLNRLEAGLDDVLAELARRGHVLAVVRLQDIELTGPEEDVAAVVIRIEQGGQAVLRDVRVPGAERTRPRLVRRTLGLRAGQTLASFDAEEVRERLLRTGMFIEVGEPRLQVAADSVTLVIPIRDEPPGSFDLAFGYLPEGSGGIVGSGHLDLLNPFGGGRRFELNLDRLPGQTSRLEAELADPYALGLPLRLAGRFAGHQQDSLYNRLAFGLEAGYMFQNGLELFATARREATRPGTAGIRIEGGRQRIARADASMFGGGIRFSQLDFRRNPRRGLSVEAVAERGYTRRSLSRVADADTTRERRRTALDRGSLAARSYVPIAGRGVLVVGADALGLLSQEYDRSDLFRIGGLRTLRGHDDEQFLVRTFVRSLLEYRYLLGRLSYVGVLVDVAYLERPALHDVEAFAAWRTGFGIGSQIDTGFSLLNVVLAMNPHEGARAPRIHIGVSFGL